MVTYNELYTESHQITELTNVLTNLLSDRLLCDSEITCELFMRYVDLVNKHIGVSDANIYTQLLSSTDKSARNMANKFMSGTREIKRIFRNYLKCRHKQNNNTLVITDHDEFLKETTEMFEMVLNRLQDETEHLYPLLRRLTGDNENVA